MKLHTALLACVLGAGAFLVAAPVEARADAPSGPASISAPAEATASPSLRPGTVLEEREYAQREAASPEVQEFEGGFIGFIILVVVIILLIMLID